MRVDLGCGEKKEKDFIGVDINAFDFGVDIIADLNRDFPFNNDFTEYIKAHHIVEHLEDSIHTMNEIWRICKDGAIVDIIVPSTQGMGAFQDPTHKTFWNDRTFDYFCSNRPLYNQGRSYGYYGNFHLDGIKHIFPEEQSVTIHAKLIAIKDKDNG